MSCSNARHGGPFIHPAPANGCQSVHQRSRTEHRHAWEPHLQRPRRQQSDDGQLRDCPCTSAPATRTTAACCTTPRAPTSSPSTTCVTHPNNFISWNLGVTRGSHGQVAATSERSTLSTPITNNSASSLVGTCVQAAFAVNLNTSRPSDRRILTAIAVRPVRADPASFRAAWDAWSDSRFWDVQREHCSGRVGTLRAWTCG